MKEKLQRALSTATSKIKIIEKGFNYEVNLYPLEEKYQIIALKKNKTILKMIEKGIVKNIGEAILKFPFHNYFSEDDSFVIFAYIPAIEYLLKEASDEEKDLFIEGALIHELKHATVKGECNEEEKVLDFVLRNFPDHDRILQKYQQI